MTHAALSLVGTGIALGFVHVLTGPDHLSALATLSANVGNCQAFSLGVRWGIGHSTGLLLVGVVLIVVSDKNDDPVEVPSKVTVVFESCVGVFMLLLGCYGVARAWQKRPNVLELLEVDELSLTTTREESVSSTPPVSNVSMSDVGHVTVVPANRERGDPQESLELQPLGQCAEDSVGTKNPLIKFAQNLSTKTVSVLIGIIHGLAGPGGVLGVIPAVQIKDWRLSTLYLGSFCFTSTLVMGCFASTYGTCSAKLGRDAQWEFRVQCFSAALSLLVGSLWLILLATGKLEDVFP